MVREIELSTQQTQQKLEEFLESRQNNLNSVFLEKEHQTKRILEYFKLINSNQVVVHDTQMEKSKKKAKKKKTKKRKKQVEEEVHVENVVDEVLQEENIYNQLKFRDQPNFD